MPTDHRPMVRGPMRTWLRFTLESEVLELLRPSSATDGEEPEAFARGLLARLREADGGLKPDDPLARSFREFRRWVDAERRALRATQLGAHSRRRRIHQIEPPPPRPGDPGTEKEPRPAQPERRRGLAALGRWLTHARFIVGRRRVRTIEPGSPLWDRWLDG